MRTKVEIKNLNEEEKEVIRILSDEKPRGFNELFKELTRRNIVGGREKYWKMIKEMEKCGIIVRAIDVTHKKRKLILLSDTVKRILEMSKSISGLAECYVTQFEAAVKNSNKTKQEIIELSRKYHKLLGEFVSNILLLPFFNLLMMNIGAGVFTDIYSLNLLFLFNPIFSIPLIIPLHIRI